jgi:4,5-DOPA dioxygenase extradiol
MNRMPSVFVSHGAPTLFLEGGPTHAFLQGLAHSLPKPAAVLCVSAHWEAASPSLTTAPSPRTIHDFYGFPEELYHVRYPAPGSPALARRAAELLDVGGIATRLDPARGLDHGAWVPMGLAYPQADVPVVQLSVQTDRGPAHHLALGRALAPLREEGVLILGSGGATHNLPEMFSHAQDDRPEGYAAAFDEWLTAAVTGGREDALVAYRTEGPEGRRNHPTAEHYLPLLVPAGSAGAGGKGRVLHRAFTYGVLSMSAYAWD